MGGPQAATVLSLVSKGKAEREGRPWTDEDERKVRAPLEEKFEKKVALTTAQRESGTMVSWLQKTREKS